MAQQTDIVHELGQASKHVELGEYGSAKGHMDTAQELIKELLYG